jgi:hypothetical protein
MIFWKRYPAQIKNETFRNKGKGRVSICRVGSDYIILLFFLSNPIKFGLKFFDSYPTRRVTGRPDPCKIIKYLLNIFI